MQAKQRTCEVHAILSLPVAMVGLHSQLVIIFLSFFSAVIILSLFPEIKQ